MGVLGHGCVLPDSQLVDAGAPVTRDGGGDSGIRDGGGGDGGGGDGGDAGRSGSGGKRSGGAGGGRAGDGAGGAGGNGKGGAGGAGAGAGAGGTGGAGAGGAGGAGGTGGAGGAGGNGGGPSAGSYAGEGAGGAAGAPPDDSVLVAGLIQFEELYSAYGDLEFSVTPSVPTVSYEQPDPVVPESLQWSVDSAYVQSSPFQELPGALRLTTKRPGTTTIKVQAVTESGKKIRSEARLHIANVTQAEWDAGEARYNAPQVIPWRQGTAAGEGPCGLPATIELPMMASCASCHNNTSTFSLEYTPTQTALYSDAQLIDIFTTGLKPAANIFSSPLLRSAPEPDCIYRAFHTWTMTDVEKKGVVRKIRAITPKVLHEIDFARLKKVTP